MQMPSNARDHHRHSRSRSRSRSPVRSSRHARSSRSPPHRRHHHRDREEEPHSHHRKEVNTTASSSSHRHKHKRRRTASPPAQKKQQLPPAIVSLPFKARPLAKRDYAAYKAIFGLYLDVQKQIVLDELDEKEAKGRWKSFVGKWNRGELAEGWYDPAMKSKAEEALQDQEMWSGSPQPQATQAAKEDSPKRDTRPSETPGDDGSSEDEFGPALPKDLSRSRHGPVIPSLQDLELRDEQQVEDVDMMRADLQYARRQDRKLQKERLEELVPRTDPGSRERQLEKKQAKTQMVRGAREAKSPGAEEVGENELMGDDGGDAYRRHVKERQKMKNEREIRKEEILRARAAEREEKMERLKEREEKTLDMLRNLAKERFG